MAARSPLINVMMGAVRKAARSLIHDFGEVENLQVSRKGPADFVSAADRKAEDILRRELQKARPRYGLLMEESGEVAGEDTSNRWIVDPLDGTTNFLHGIPHFSISLALERDGELIAGLVYAPVADEMFWAEKGTGARMNDRRLRVSGRRRMEELVFAIGIPTMGLPEHQLFLRQTETVMALAAGVRCFGSAALDLAYVAAGRYDGYWESGLHPWDMAAGIVLVREAGGMVGDLEGGTKMLDGGGILAANPSLHDPLGRILGAAAAVRR